MRKLLVLGFLTLLLLTCLPVFHAQIVHKTYLTFSNPPKEGDSLEIGNTSFLYTDHVFPPSESIKINTSENIPDAVHATAAAINLRPALVLCTADGQDEGGYIILSSEEEELHAVSHSDAIVVTRE